MPNASRTHWETVYAERDPRDVSWFEEVPQASLDWIARTGISPDAAVLDAGGGASSLAAELVARGYTDVTVADISSAALERVRTPGITVLQADLRTHAFARRYDLWHDRAVLHFMVDDADRDAYVETLTAAIAPGGHVIAATFGPDGPTQCSNLPVRRYGAEDLAALLGEPFALVDGERREHRTPSGRSQQFTYAWLQRSQ